MFNSRLLAASFVVGNAEKHFVYVLKTNKTHLTCSIFSFLSLFICNFALGRF